MKKIILLITLMFMLPLSVSAYDSGYQIDSYDVNIKVNEDNTLDIEEKIIANFKENRHGIIRSIPKTNEVKRADGSTETNHVKISDISVNEEYETSIENGNLSIKIGNANRTITGPKEYIIKYKYSLSKDKSKDFDELYFNIIGSQWDTYISKVTFNITMPKDFDESKVGFSSGFYGQIGTNRINYTVNNNVISGNYNAVLAPNNALTIRVELDEGYFVYPQKSIFYYIFTFLMPIIFVVIAFYWWVKYGKDEKPVETVEFYPPENYSSLEIGFLYRGQLDSKDVISLLISLANKGYLKIEDTSKEKKGIFSKKSDYIFFIKQKEYDGDNAGEKIFFNDLFKHAGSDGKTVKLSDLEQTFYTTIPAVLSTVDNKEYSKKIFESNTKSKTILICLMIFIVILFNIVLPVLEYSGMEFIVFAATLIFGFLFSLFFLISQKTNIIMKIFGVLFSMSFIAFPIITIIPEMDSSLMFTIVYGSIFILILLGLALFMPKRNKYGVEILGRIKGFKNFLETAEKPQLEAQVEKNPTYFYDILPYTYVLGVSDKWMKNFEGITLEPPMWYSGYVTFNMTEFSTSINNTISSAQFAMTSSPSSSGSSGGGGFSGGGSGGGGGSSW